LQAVDECCVNSGAINLPEMPPGEVFLDPDRRRRGRADIGTAAAIPRVSGTCANKGWNAAPMRPR
jgi:hypothetical protein